MRAWKGPAWGASALAFALALAACVPATPAPTPTTSAPAPATAAPTPVASATAPACAEPGGCYGAPRQAGRFDAAAVPAASGLAASRRNPGLLWLADDRAGSTGVHVLTADGTLLGTVAIEGLDAANVEALAVGSCGDGAPAQPCLYVGDIGDNRRARDHVTVHRVPEPDLSRGLPGAPVAAAAARLRYPHAAHDAEALLVDDRGLPLVVTKATFDRASGATGETRLYRAPSFGDVTLADLGAVVLPAPAEPLHSLLVGTVVTGADHAGGRVLLRTYDQVLLYAADDPRAGVEGFATWPVRALPSPLEPQSEAVAWAADGCGYYSAGEQAGDLWFVGCRP